MTAVISPFDTLSSSRPFGGYSRLRRFDSDSDTSSWDLGAEKDRYVSESPRDESCRNSKFSCFVSNQQSSSITLPDHSSAFLRPSPRKYLRCFVAIGTIIALGFLTSLTIPIHNFDLLYNPTITDPNTPVDATFNTSSSIDFSRLAVLIEHRDHPLLIPILQIFLSRTPSHWPFQVWFGNANEERLRTSPQLSPYIDSGRLLLRPFPENTYPIHDGTSLSRFLTQPWFWEQLAPAEHLLFFQLDSMLCGNSIRSLDEFLGLDKTSVGYDWVGTSTSCLFPYAEFQRHCLPVLFILYVLFAGAVWEWRGYPATPYGGNGGLSLRKRSTMVRITKEFGHTWELTQTPEDLWFAMMLELSGGVFPPQDIAMQFSFVSTILWP